MTFLALNAVFLVLAAVVLYAVVRLRGRADAPSAAAIGLAVAALFVMTAVFDNIMIAAGLFDYGQSHRLGILIGRAPIEDFAYPLAGAVLLPALWHLLGAHRLPPGRHDGRSGRRKP